jgi:hypothetical protein
MHQQLASIGKVESGLDQILGPSDSELDARQAPVQSLHASDPEQFPIEVKTQRESRRP